MEAALAAARIGDPIEHTPAMLGFAIGAVAGLGVGIALLGAAVAAPFTGGLSLVAAAGAIAAVGGIAAITGGGALAGGKIASLIGSYDAGPIETGSGNAFTNGRLAARAVEDTAACKDHAPHRRIAQGSDSVFINGFPAARIKDKTECDGTISEGSPNVFIGRGQQTYLDISPEIPAWMTTTAQWMVVVGGAVAVGFGGLAAFMSCGLAGLANFAGGIAVGVVESLAGKEVGGAIGEALWGEKGREIGETIGEMTGIRGASQAVRTTRGHPIDVATGELLIDQIDFRLPGPLPLIWQRNWSSRSTHDGDLGSGWSHPFDMALEPLPDHRLVQLRLPDGRLTFLPWAEPGLPSLNTAERLILHREARGWRVAGYDGLNWHFPAVAAGIAPLSAMVDAAGNAIILHRDATGRLHGITDSGGRELSVELDALGRILGIDGPHPDTPRERMRLVGYAYAADGSLATVTDARGSVTRYRSEAKLVVEEHRRGGLAFTFRWDDLMLGRNARVVETWGTDGLYYCRFDYVPHERVTIVTDDRGGETLYTYNRLDLVIRERDPLGHVRRWRWAQSGSLLEYRDGEDRITSFAYDEFGRLTAQSLPAEGSTRLVYAPLADNAPLASASFGLPVAATLPAGGTQRFAYDDRGQLAAAEDPVGRVLRYLRDPRGLPLAVSDQEGLIARYGWDASGNLIRESDAREAGVDYAHDALGRVVARRGDGEETRYARDANGNAVAVTRVSDGASVTLAYDAEDRAILHRDARGRETRWDYAGLPFPVRRQASDGGVLRYEYDAVLNLAALINEKGERAEFHRDAADRLIEEIGFDGRTQRYVHDASGLLTERRTAAGTTRYVRDARGLIARTELPDGTTHSFGWNAAGWLTAASTPDRALNWSHDPAGQLLCEVQDGTALNHRYDLRGRRVATTLPDGREVAVDWDAGDAFTAVRLDGRTVASVIRDRRGREVERMSGLFRLHSEYDPAGRLLRQQGGTARGTGATVDRHYRYDPLGQLVAMSDLARGDKRYRYDACDRLVGVDGALPEAFVADPAGNVLPVEASRVTDDAPGNRLRVWGDRRFEYDADGRRVRELIGAGEGRERRYRWDGAGRLAELIERSRRGMRIHRYGYDALGRRAWKDVAILPPDAANEGGDPPAPAFTRTHFLWDGDVLLAEASAPAGEVPADLLATLYLHEPASFRPLAIARRDANGVVLHHYQLDRLGTPQELVNDNGVVTWRAELSAWGAVARVAEAEIDNPLRFQGQYEDAETGLLYNRHRYYDPHVARYTAPDPIGFEGGINVHAYVPDPTSWVDPFGLEWKNGTGNPSLPEVGVTPNGGPTFAGTDHLFPTSGDQKNIVRIPMQGSRSRDFTQADKLAGITAADRAGTYTWHHLDDFDPKTGMTTMELVRTDSHRAVSGHKGSVYQFEQHTGLKYSNSGGGVAYAEKQGWNLGTPCKT